MNFLEELVKRGVIQASQIGEIRSRANESFGGDIEKVLIESGIPEEKILKIKGEYLGLPVKKIRQRLRLPS